MSGSVFRLVVVAKNRGYSPICPILRSLSVEKRLSSRPPGPLSLQKQLLEVPFIKNRPKDPAGVKL